MEENNLQRFIKKQEEYYEKALKEIKEGGKKTCWMWYIFPQIRGLGMSTTSKFFGIENIEEAIQYLQNEKLRNNLIEITQALLDLGDVNITKIMGFIDDSKLKSSMTLFNEIEKISGIDCGHIFEKVLHQFFKDEKDEKTLKILENQKLNNENNSEIKNNPNLIESNKIESNEYELNNNNNNKIQGNENLDNIDKGQNQIIIDENNNDEGNKKIEEDIILRNKKKDNIINNINEEKENKLKNFQNSPTEIFEKNKENQSEIGNNEKNNKIMKENENFEEENLDGGENEFKVESLEEKNAKCCEACIII